MSALCVPGGDLEREREDERAAQGDEGGRGGCAAGCSLDAAGWATLFDALDLSALCDVVDPELCALSEDASANSQGSAMPVSGWSALLGACVATDVDSAAI